MQMTTDDCATRTSGGAASSSGSADRTGGSTASRTVRAQEPPGAEALPPALVVVPAQISGSASVNGGSATQIWHMHGKMVTFIFSSRGLPVDKQLRNFSVTLSNILNDHRCCHQTHKILEIMKCSFT
jgi:hypothetical protein